MSLAAPTTLDAVIATLRGGDMAGARTLARTALAAGLEHPLLLNLHAMDLEEAGRFEEALESLRRAHVLSPADFTILNACGLCLARMDRQEEALACFDQALALRPEFGQAWFNRGCAQERLGETAQAAVAYEKAATINPDNAQAWANLAFLAARRGDRAAACAAAAKALALQPGHPTAELALAGAEMDQPAVAERRLEALLARPLGPFDHALALGQIGDARAASSRPAEAFAAYVESNAIFRREARPRFEGAGQPTLPQTLGWLRRWAESLDAARWRAGSAPTSNTGGEAAHVFLLGFPRSGTTLAETVLANHPDVVSLEERNTLHAGVLDFLTDAKALARLETAGASALDRCREDYWRRVARFGVDARGRIFIDKNPFNTLKLPLIYRLFPAARIIFAVRDPRDVVLSCFRRRFDLNASTYEYLDLSRTALNYADTMGFAEILRRKQPLAEFQLVYERLVEDFAGVARAACAFIGAEWRDDLAHIAARARRGDVASASAAQIARGLYADGAGQWRAYRDQLAPILPILAPWVRRFGYPAD